MLLATMVSVILMNAVAPMNVPLRPLNRGRRCKEKTAFFEVFLNVTKDKGLKDYGGLHCVVSNALTSMIY